MMKSKKFIEQLKKAVQNKTLYVSGCFGAPMNEANKTRYMNNNDYNRQAARQKMIQAASADTFGFDCVCLVKGVLWGWDADASKVYGGAVYKSNDVPDIHCDAMINECSDVSTDFSKITPGELLWMKGHCGVYIGEGLGIECTPKWSNDVQITAVGNIGKVNGYNTRTWTKHGKLPYVDYSDQKEEDPETPEFKVGETVRFTGTKHYTSANAVTAKTCKPGLAVVTQIYQYGKSKHPYHLIRTANGGSTVYGWVDVKDVAKYVPEPEYKAPTTSAAVTLWVVRKGNCGATVKTLQTLLNAHGAKLDVDGEFGPKTDTALRAFQTANGLTVDGVAGPKTWAKIIDT